MKELKDYLHYYTGGEVIYLPTGLRFKNVSFKSSYSDGYINVHHSKGMVMCLTNEIKPILRRVESMTYEEAFDFALMCMTSKHHLSEEDQVTEDEMSCIELAISDGGNLLDADVSVYIGVSVRCFEGAVLIKKDGSIVVKHDEEEYYQPIDDIAFKITWLLSKHFDLFGLIDANLAIDAATLTQTHNK